MTTSERIPLFLLGVGFIGGSLLQSLIDSNKYTITSLVRGDDKAEKLRSLGVTPLLGSLDSDELIVKATLENDVIIHAATADDLPSVASILKGLAQRPASKKAAIYIHTSGTGELSDKGEGLHAAKHIFSDKRPEEIDALPDSAPHRDVDLLIKNAVEGGKVGTARVAIILPPLIYGIGTGPFNRLSIQVPGWVKRSIEDKVVTVTGKGAAIWNHIHVSNLVLAYETILDHLSTTPPPSPLYFFAETGHHEWLVLAKKIQSVLLAKGLVGPELKFDPTPNYMGSNSRSSAELIREYGWKPVEKISVYDSVDIEVEEIIKNFDSVSTVVR